MIKCDFRKIPGAGFAVWEVFSGAWNISFQVAVHSWKREKLLLKEHVSR